MIRRHSTKSKLDLQRRKSTTSVRSVPLEHISVAVAQRDAKLAAIQAFSRGQERRSAEMDRFPLQLHSSSGRKETMSPTRQSRNDSILSENNEQTLRQRQSVRFVGPDSGLQTRASRISMRSVIVPKWVDAGPRRSIYKSESSHDVGSGVRHSILRNTQNQDILPPYRTSSCGKTLVGPHQALRQDHLQALESDHQYYTPEDDVASVPSSYRRVRKTRSMFTTRHSVRNSYDARHDAPLFATSSTTEPEPVQPGHARPRLSFFHKIEIGAEPSAPVMRAPKSMSFLGLRRGRAGAADPDHDLAFDHSPAQTVSPIYNDSPPSQILPKASVFLGSKGHKVGRSMRTSLRHSSSRAALPTTATMSSFSMSVHGSLSIKARKVSSSIKSRFKNLFINKSEDGAKMPAQQIEARKTHVSDLFDEDRFPLTAPDTVAFHDRGSISRVSSHIPSLHAVPSEELLRSRKGSIDSFRSEDRRVSDDKSRVTSWASTEANTVIAHRTHDGVEERGKQRLSVITEHGARATSPSLSQPKPGLQTITSREELGASSILERLPPGATIDSQRVYSALMKRMSQTQQRFNDIIGEQRKLSNESDPFRTLSPPTTDASSDDDGLLVVSHIHAPAESQRELTGSSSDTRENTPAEGFGLKQETCHRSLSPPIHLTPKGADSTPVRPITDRSSVFFGSPTSHLFRTRSPWRRTLQKAMDQDRATAEEPTAATLVVDKKADSVSAYSQDTQVHSRVIERIDSMSTYSQDTQRHNMSSKQESFLSSTPEHGAAQVDETLTYHPTRERMVSTASSADWKTRLAHDVAKEEKLPLSPTKVSGRSSEIEYVVPTMPRAFGHGHVREAAQIASYEEDECNASPAVRIPTNPTTPLGAIEANVLRLTPQQRSVMQTTPPGSLLGQDVVVPMSTTTTASLEDDGVTFVLPKDAMRPRASPLDEDRAVRDLDPIVANHLGSPVQKAGLLREARSLAHLQAYRRVRAEETGSPRRLGSPTVRLMRKTPARLETDPSTRISTPGFTNAFERQFGSLTQKKGADPPAKENQSPHGNAVGEASRGKTNTPATTRPQVRGSKTMVDMFLTSRRRARASGDGSAFV